MSAIIQGSEEWFQARLGKVTASRICDVMATIKSGESAARRNYRAQLVVERMTGLYEAGYINSAMQWGIDQEPAAREAYQFISGREVGQIGYVDHPEIPMTGASPDGLVEADGMLEIKCPTTATHIDYLRAGVAPAEYRLQMLWQMECANRAWVDFVSFDPRMPVSLRLFIIRYHRDDERLDLVRGEVAKFLKEVEAMVEELERIGRAP